MNTAQNPIPTVAPRRTEEQWRAWAKVELDKARRERFAWSALMVTMSLLALAGTIAVTVPAFYLHHIVGNIIGTAGIIAAPFNAQLVGSNQYWNTRCGLAAEKREQSLWNLWQGHTSPREFLNNRKRR